MMMSGGVY